MSNRFFALIRVNVYFCLVNLLNRWLYGIKKNKDSLDDGNRMQLVDGV